MRDWGDLLQQNLSIEMTALVNRIEISGKEFQIKKNLGDILQVLKTQGIRCWKLTEKGVCQLARAQKRCFFPIISFMTRRQALFNTIILLILLVPLLKTSKTLKF